MNRRPELELFHPTAKQLRRRAGRDVEVVDRDGVLLATRASADPWASRVYQTRWTEENAEHAINAVLALFEERGRPFVWTVTPESTPGSLAERLARRGLTRELVGRMLVAPLPLVKVRPNADVRIEEVTDRAQMLTALRVHPTRTDEQLGSAVDERMSRLGEDWHAAIAYLGGRPVGTARWWTDRELGGVYLSGAETLPEHRNRGVYSTLVAYRGERALAEGCRYAGITADERTSAPILLKRGVEDLGRAVIFLKAR